ncbi:MAG: hypothetical protein KAS23_03570 [Anaerohalosphaera sp.]|nr:hypothetical protein [Anaerohalosphaera sp.]
MLSSGNREFLKYVAIVTMLIDHTGVYIYPAVDSLRIIGRIAFPLFAILIGCGVRSTRNLTSYHFRLFLLAVLSQPLYMACHYYLRFNVVFTLLLGAWLGARFNLFRLIPVCIIVYLFPFEYGISGILLVAWCCYYCNDKAMVSVGIIIFAFLSTVLIESDIQMLSTLAMIPLYINCHIPRYGKYWQYAVFPLNYAFFAIYLAIKYH